MVASWGVFISVFFGGLEFESMMNLVVAVLVWAHEIPFTHVDLTESRLIFQAEHPKKGICRQYTGNPHSIIRAFSALLRLSGCSCC